jgi:hypothetical protein
MLESRVTPWTFAGQVEARCGRRRPPASRSRPGSDGLAGGEAARAQRPPPRPPAGAGGPGRAVRVGIAESAQYLDTATVTLAAARPGSAAPGRPGPRAAAAAAQGGGRAYRTAVVLPGGDSQASSLP